MNSSAPTRVSALETLAHWNVGKVGTSARWKRCNVSTSGPWERQNVSTAECQGALGRWERPSPCEQPLPLKLPKIPPAGAGGRFNSNLGSAGVRPSDKSPPAAGQF